MLAEAALICWNPGGAAEVVAWPDTARKSDSYSFTGGAAFTHWRKAAPQMRDLLMFIEFQTMVVRDGVDPLAAHAAFLKIREYRLRIAPDCSGAEQD